MKCFRPWSHNMKYFIFVLGESTQRTLGGIPGPGARAPYNLDRSPDPVIYGARALGPGRGARAHRYRVFSCPHSIALLQFEGMKVGAGENYDMFWV